MSDKVCILFHRVPDGTNFLKGHYSYVSETEAMKYIKDGFGVQWDPHKGREARSEGAMTLTDLPLDLPGRDQLFKSGIAFMEIIRDMKSFRHIPGIGASTEKKLLKYINGES